MYVYTYIYGHGNRLLLFHKKKKMFFDCDVLIQNAMIFVIFILFFIVCGHTLAICSESCIYYLLSFFGIKTWLSSSFYYFLKILFTLEIKYLAHVNIQILRYKADETY